MKNNGLQIEYRPCSCAPYVRQRPRIAGDRAVKDPGAAAPEFFEQEGYAARRFIELLKKDRRPLVHVGDPGRSCLHVKAVVFQGERYEEDGRAR